MMKGIATISDAPERKILEPLEGIEEYFQDANICRAASRWQSREVRLKQYGHGKT